MTKKTARFALYIAILILGACVSLERQLGEGEEKTGRINDPHSNRPRPGAKATKLVEAESSRIVNVDGQVQASSNKEKAVKDARTGETLASVKESSQLEQRGPGEQPHSVSRTQVDVPALGIHETKVEDSSNANNNLQRQQQLLPGPGPAEKRTTSLTPGTQRNPTVPTTRLLTWLNTS
ncbi:hypothetical protein MTO96_005525 [Rhipicephalus appendiculatus]